MCSPDSSRDGARNPIRPPLRDLTYVLRRIAICLAFATWCFLNTWVECAEGKSVYFARYDPLRAVVAPVLCWELAITAGMWFVWECVRRRGMSRSVPLHLSFLAVCFVPMGVAAVAAMRALPVDLSPIVRRPGFWPVILIAAIAPLGFALLRPIPVSRLVRQLFLYSWPVLIVILVQAARGTLVPSVSYNYADHALAPPLRVPSKGVRVVWIVFDELSQAIAYDRRPAGLRLPNLDRLKSESFYASTAKAPGDSTEISMPSLVLGEQVTACVPEGADKLYLRTTSRPEPVTWSEVPNVFDKARSLGFNTALVGWFHPYGRLLSRSLTKCYWTAGWLNSGAEEASTPRPLLDAMWFRAQLQLAALPLAGHLPGVFPGVYHRREKVRRFSYMLERTVELVTDPSIGLVLVHLPVPHPPAIYDRSTGVMTAEGRIGYLDSVVLADRTLGLLRQRMERAGVWDETAIIVSADHGWRTYLWRGDPEWTADEERACHADASGVPFLMKLPGQTSGLAYSKPFSTISTERLITDVLSGSLKDPAGLPDSVERLEADRRRLIAAR